MPVTFLCLLENFIIHHHHHPRVMRIRDVVRRIHMGFTISEHAVTLTICPFWQRMCDLLYQTLIQLQYYYLLFFHAEWHIHLASKDHSLLQH